MILADPVRLQQIIWNLLTNAIKFSHKGGKIEVQLEQTGAPERRFTQIRVIDHGKGIPEEFLTLIFNRFTQADSTSTRVHGGLGLGLSIVRNLTELQGGTVRAENASAGSGAIFTVTFPLLSPTSAITQTKSAPQAEPDDKEQLSLDGLRVLIVDDDEGTRESLSIYLKSFGAEVLTTESAKETLKVFPDFKPHVFVSDIAMPGEDGYALIRQIRNLKNGGGRDVPALALTAYATSEDRELALAAGFQAHVAKPVEANELARVILRVSGRQKH